MSDNKAKKMSPELIATLSKYEDRFRRALRGEKVELSSVGAKELEKAHLEVFGTKQSMTQCCRGSRNTANRMAPIAKAYFAQINGSEKNTTGLAESVEESTPKFPVSETETVEDSTKVKEATISTPAKKKTAKTPKKE